MTVSTASYVVWAVIAGAAIMLWLLSLSRRQGLVRPSELISWLALHPIFRICLVVLWMFLGWHLFAR
jgi:hypothetical protein